MFENAHTKYRNDVEEISILECSNSQLLVSITEEAAEVIQAATKIIRFGHDNGQPTRLTEADNKDDLVREVKQLFQIIHEYLSRHNVDLDQELNDWRPHRIVVFKGEPKR